MNNILISTTAVQRGFGTDRYKRVVFLTKQERLHVRSGGTVAYWCGRLSGGNHGTCWRVAVDHGRYGFAPMVPSDDVVKYLDENENSI